MQGNAALQKPHCGNSIILIHNRMLFEAAR
jgi:hypothetical protein